MVAPLARPSHDDLALTKLVIKEREAGRNKDYFLSISDVWQERVALYSEYKGDPTKFPASPIAEEDKGKFVNLYGAAKKGQCHFPTLEKVRGTKQLLLYCPACGEDGTPDTLDHYLPKTHFPEFSIHTKNLVPMCDICQRLKLDTYVDSNGDRKYLHPYFDVIAQPLLWIRISKPYSAPRRFELQIDTGLPDSLAGQVTRHAIGLNLSARVETYCQTKYIHLLKLMATNRCQKNGDVVGTLKTFLAIEELKALNSWGAIFYRSVLADPELILYLTTGVFPSFLAVE